ncbi:MAG: single-stranded DNA-binding protein [Synergistaceae bacterium]|jgi:single-strand DNA-binding protein|nr:single-stranded DNA-binding protein [Synergistaceae bacterium]
MAASFNKVIIMGNLARDPEVRSTVDKRTWVRFTVAVDYSWKSKNGEVQNGCDFIPVVAWDRLAENCGRYLKKGSGVFIEGRIKVRSYEAKDGSGKRYATDVYADAVKFIGGGGRRDGDGGAPSDGGRDAGFGKSMRDTGFGDGGDFMADMPGFGEGEDKENEIPF